MRTNSIKDSGTLKDSSDWLSWEVFLLGGASILMCLAAWAFTDRAASVNTMSQLAFGLAFAVNHPHFLSSYALLYKDFKKNIPRQFRYFWAAVIVPILLGGSLVYALMAERADILGQLVNAMYFLVGWHYVKQVFGCIIVSSVRRSIFYKPLERKLILSNLFCLWGISFLGSQVLHTNFSFYGISYSSMGLPPILLQLAFLLCGLTALAVVVLHVRKYVQDGTLPSPGAVVAMVSLYVWYFPMFSHPTFSYLIPFFHSLQYLALAWVFKKNQVDSQVAELKGSEKRGSWLMGYLGFIISVVALGALAFEFVPKFLDSQNWINNPLMGSSPILASFLLFINIHHYFIDNVIWRSNNVDVKKYLFNAPKAASRDSTNLAA